MERLLEGFAALSWREYLFAAGVAYIITYFYRSFQRRKEKEKNSEKTYVIQTLDKRAIDRCKELFPIDVLSFKGKEFKRGMQIRITTIQQNVIVGEFIGLNRVNLVCIKTGNKIIAHQLEKIAAKYVLDNISASYDRTSGLVARAASFTEDTGLPLTLGNFLDYYHLDPRAIYGKKICFARLCVRAGTASDFTELLEETMTKALARFAVVDSRRWIQFLLNLLLKLDDTDFAALSPREQRMLQMFYVTVWGKAAERWDDEEVLDNLYALSDSPVLLHELQALLQYQYNRIDFIDEPVDVGFDCPLDLHCTYTRDQLLVALDFLKPATVREGVKWLPDKNLDVFFVTLNKADKDYSPTTMYKDYSINESLFHWQSQSTTAENSATGQRYIHHREKGSRVLLFVREFKSDSRFGGAAAYTYLGTVNYVTHEGSRPMNITWKLDRPIPAKFLKKTNKLVVG
jgi:hypothetical protein